MACTIKNNLIKLTKGDSLTTKVSITDADGNEYIPTEDDKIRFALKKEYNDKKTLIVKDIPYDTLILRLESEDTKKLEPGDYRYDIEITLSDGTVDTFIDRQKFVITEEVF
jgi:hypothetical protein